jgi:hypothetical protein
MPSQEEEPDEEDKEEEPKEEEIAELVDRVGRRFTRSQNGPLHE